MISKLTQEAHYEYLKTKAEGEKKILDIQAIFNETKQAYDIQLAKILDKHIEDSGLDRSKIETFDPITGEIKIKE